MSNYWDDDLIDESWLSGGSTPPPLTTLRALYNKASEQKNAAELQQKIAQIIDIKLKEIDSQKQYAEVSDNDILAGVSYLKDNSPDNSETYLHNFSTVLDARLDKIKQEYDASSSLSPFETIQLKTLSLVSEKLGRTESADIQEMIGKETTDEKVKASVFEASLSATEKEADEIRKGLALDAYSLSAADKEIIYGRLVQHAGFENAAQNDKALGASVLDNLDVYDKKGNLSPLYEGCAEIANKIQYEFPEGTSADEQARLTKMYNEQLLANAGQRAAQNILKEKDFLQRYNTTEEIAAAYKQRVAQQFERSAVLAGLASNEETGILAKDIVVDKKTGKVSYKGDSQADIAGAIEKIMDGQAKINPFAVKMDSEDLEKETKEVSKQLNLKRVKEEKLSFLKKSKKLVSAVAENLIKKGGWKKVAANALAFGGAAMLMASAAPAVVATGAAIYAGATAANAFVMPVYDTLSREMYEKGVKGLGNRLRYLKENWKRARTEKYAEKGFMKRAWIKTAGGIAVGAATFGLGVGGLRGTLQGTVARQGTMAGGKMASLLSSIKMLSKAQREAKKARTVATAKALQTAKGYVKGDAIALSSVAVSALTTDIIKFSGQMQSLPQEAQADMADIQKETAAINARVEASVEQPAPQQTAEMAQPAPQQAAQMAHPAPQQTAEMTQARAAATVEKESVVQQNVAEKISSLRGRLYGKVDDIVQPVKFGHELPKAATLAHLRGTEGLVAEAKPMSSEYGVQVPEAEAYGKNGPIFENDTQLDSHTASSYGSGRHMAGIPEDNAASQSSSNEFYGDDNKGKTSFTEQREKMQSSFTEQREKMQSSFTEQREKMQSSFTEQREKMQSDFSSYRDAAVKSMAAHEPEIPTEIKVKAENAINDVMKELEQTNEIVSAPDISENGDYPSYVGKRFLDLTAEEKNAFQSDWTKGAQKELMRMEAEKEAAEGNHYESFKEKGPYKTFKEEVPQVGLPKEEVEEFARLNENAPVDSDYKGEELPVGKIVDRGEELKIDNDKTAALETTTAPESEIKIKAKNYVNDFMKDLEKTNETVLAPKFNENGEYPSYNGKKFLDLTEEEKNAFHSDWTKEVTKEMVKREMEKAAAEGKPMAFDSDGNRYELLKEEVPFGDGKLKQPEVFNEENAAEGKPMAEAPATEKPVAEKPVENKAAEAPAAEKPVENAAEAAQLPEGASVSKNPWGVERTTDKDGNIKIECHMTKSDMYKMYAKMNLEHRAAYNQMQTDYVKAEDFVTRMGGRRVVALDLVAAKPFITSESQEELYDAHLRDLNNYAKENGCEFIRTKEGKYVLTKNGYCSKELGNDAVFEKAANVGKTPEEIAKNPFKVPDIGKKPETPNVDRGAGASKKGFIGRFKNNGGR